MINFFYLTDRLIITIIMNSSLIVNQVLTQPHLKSSVRGPHVDNPVELFGGLFIYVIKMINLPEVI